MQGPGELTSQPILEKPKSRKKESLGRGVSSVCCSCFQQNLNSKEPEAEKTSRTQEKSKQKEVVKEHVQLSRRTKEPKLTSQAWQGGQIWEVEFWKTGGQRQQRMPVHYSIYQFSSPHRAHFKIKHGWKLRFQHPHGAGRTKKTEVQKPLQRRNLVNTPCRQETSQTAIPL